MTSSPIPPPQQQQQQQPKPVQLVQQAADKSNSLMMVPQPLAVIPTPQTMVSQYAPGHHGPPLVALYPTSTLVQVIHSGHE